MSGQCNILILGASYGSLLGMKLALAGHDAAMVCLPAEAEAINRDGAILRIPVKGRDAPVLINSKDCPGTLRAISPDQARLADYDLVALAMQEPQYRAEPVRRLLDRVALSGKPTLSIMNMPPIPFLARIPGVDVASLTNCYTDASVWDNFDPANFSLCSPDPQAFRPPDEPINLLQVSLPTNFKAARFEKSVHTDLLRHLQADIEAIRYKTDDGPVELPVKLKVHDSLFVPLAKWSMLLTGNYQCVRKGEMVSIRDAVHGDLDASRRMYDWVADLCVALGADRADLVPFEKYANAATGLVKPSSAARALLAGAQAVERVDRLVQALAAQKGMRSAEVDHTVELVDGWLAHNRREEKVG